MSPPSSRRARGIWRCMVSPWSIRTESQVQAMKTALTVLAGLAAGVVGALVVGYFNKPSAAPAAKAEAPETAPRPVIIPPGWDTNLVKRVANLERGLTEVQAEVAKAPGGQPTAVAGPAPPGMEAEQREQERLQHYNKELAFRQKFIEDHDRESVDSPWSAPTE